MYRWTCEEDNGCSVSLSFEGTNAVLHIENHDETTEVEGLCVTDNETLTICDSDNGNSYHFRYRLFGDRVEVTFSTGTLVLKKAN